MALWHYTVDLDWSGPGSPGVNVWDIRTDDQALVDELQGAVDAIAIFYEILTLNQILAAPYTCTGRSEAVNIISREAEPLEGFVREDVAGDDNFSGVNQMLLTLRTSSRTRRGRGRKFIGPVATNVMDSDGTPVAAAITNLQSAGQSLVDASSGINGWAIGVYSSVDGVFRDLTGVQARNYFGALRSRRD